VQVDSVGHGAGSGQPDIEPLAVRGDPLGGVALDILGAVLAVLHLQILRALVVGSDLHQGDPVISRPLR